MHARAHRSTSPRRRGPSADALFRDEADGPEKDIYDRWCTRTDTRCSHAKINASRSRIVHVQPCSPGGGLQAGFVVRVCCRRGGDGQVLVVLAARH